VSKKIIVFGANGGIGSAVVKNLVDLGYNAISVDCQQIDFSKPDSDEKIYQLLSDINPEIIINAAGVFGSNDQTHHNTIDINFGSNWSIVRYLMKNNTRPVRFIMLGSIAYRQGRSWAMVYTASKAALYSLWQGARDYFNDTPITIDLVNPQRVLTNMTADRYNPELQYLEPDFVAKKISELIEQNNKSSCIDIEFDLVDNHS
jgi:short-subunit dehydrogenase